MAALTMALPAAADTKSGADPGRGADKVIALVRAQGCDYAKLEGRLAKAGKALASDSRTRRVIIDRPADPAHNPDLAGQPSPIVGALEVSAKQGTVKEIARKVRRQLGSVCRSDIYIVHERRLMARTRSWELGEASPETKVLVTMNRKPGVTKAEFVEEWTGPHAELSLDWRRRRGGPGHYVQNLVAETLGRDSPQLDGIGEIEGPRAAPPSEEERKARVQTATHAQTFQDMERSVMFVAREVILKD